MSTIETVLGFWFKELSPKQWFAKSDDLDRTIKARFESTHAHAVKGELYLWRTTALGRLAEIIVLDQFSRNIYRDSPQAFAQDSLALILAQEMVAQKLDEHLPTEQRAFVYLPYMHSESKFIHEEAVRLFSLPGLEDNLKFEHLHKDIIDRFGRYPHRNEVLKRPSTPAELEFLKTHEGF